MADKPPPAYSEIDTQGAPPPFHSASGYPSQPYPQGYQYQDGQAKGPEVAGAAFSPDQNPAAQYPPGQYPPGAQYPPGQYQTAAQYPPGQYPPAAQYPPPPPPPSGCQKPAYPPGQYPQYPAQFPQHPPYTPGAGPPPGVFPPGHYGQPPYGQPSATVVVTQPSGATVVVAQSLPPDNLLLSVLACLCCFCPVGMFAIMYSWQAKSANEHQDYTAALRYGSKAKKLAMISITIGVVIIIISFALRLVSYFSRSAYNY